MGINHGGDIYRHKVEWDFSVNTNPLGPSEAVRQAYVRAAESIDRYPDLAQSSLKEALAIHLGLRVQDVLLGNGASELLMAYMQALRPASVLLATPCFEGYARAARAVGAEIQVYALEAGRGFLAGEDLWQSLEKGPDMLVLANPNNPTGRWIDWDFLHSVAVYCQRKGIYFLLDESFAYLSDAGRGHTAWVKEFSYFALLGGFTKSSAMPGLRLGYILCKDEQTRSRIQAQLPEWNVSIPAQEAGLAALGDGPWVERARELIRKEKPRLSGALEEMGIRVWPSEANFLLCHSPFPVYKRLLEKGILVRDGRRFPGLGKGYFRVAVREAGENDKLLEALAALLGKSWPMGADKAIYLAQNVPEIREMAHTKEDGVSAMATVDFREFMISGVGESIPGKSRFFGENLASQEALGIHSRAGAAKAPLHYEEVEPERIEARSMEILSGELEAMGLRLDAEQAPLIKRAIHTTADFSYAQTLRFSPGACQKALEYFRRGVEVVTDTNMALSGINKSALEKWGGRAYCFMADGDVALEAKERGVTRAAVCMERAMALGRPVVAVVGNAPTALLRIRELYDAGLWRPALVIGVPVGFVNVEYAKEKILETDLDYIINQGRKGGSNVAAALCNALLYEAAGR